MKKALSLQKLIELQRTIEGMINEKMYQIISNNFIKKGSEQEDVGGLYKEYDLLLDQLNIVKLALSKGNQKRTKLDRLTNQEIIFEKSNLERKASMLRTLFDDKLKKSKPGDFQISKDEIEDDLLKVEERISKIKQTMTEFNNSTKIKVQIFEELNLL